MNLDPLEIHLTLTVWDVIFFFALWSVGTYLKAFLGHFWKARTELWQLGRAAAREAYRRQLQKNSKKS